MQTADELVALTGTFGLPMPRAYAFGYLGWEMARSGQVAEGLRLAAETERLLSIIGALVHGSFSQGLHAETLLIAAQYAEASSQIEKALATAQAGERGYLSRLYRTRAAVLRHLRGSTAPEVEIDLRRAVATAREQDAKGWEIAAAADLAVHLAETGRRDEARDVLAPVYGCFTEGFEVQPLRRAKMLLGEFG
ncbi:MAG TPA: hypothetical protein VE993_00035 [Stellaceae bacterium]|nr:hypothetical protein [Stellaceae bacterium]